MTGCTIVEVVCLNEMKGYVVWKYGEVRDDIGRVVSGVGGNEVPFAKERERNDENEEIQNGAGGEEREGEEGAVVMGKNLKSNRGVALIPGGVNVKDLDSAVVRWTGRLLCGGADDLRDGETEAWRREIRVGNRKRRRRGLG